MRASIRAAAVLALAATAGAVEPAGAQNGPPSWLVLGPVPGAQVPFADTGNAALFDPARLEQGVRWPEAGDSLMWIGGRALHWRASAAGTDGTIGVEPATAGPARAYAITYLDADRWQEANIRPLGAGVRAWLDGERVTGVPVQLTQGKHLLLVESSHEAGATGTWRFGAHVESATEGAKLTLTGDPARPPTWRDLIGHEQPVAIALGPRGTRAALVLRTEDWANDRWTSRIEVLGVPDGEVLTELRLGSDASQPVWSRDGSRLAFVTPTDEKDGSGSDLWLWTPDTQVLTRVLRAEPGLSGPQFSPDGAWIYFTSTRGSETSNRDDGLTHLTEVWERWSSWPLKARLYGVNVANGTRVELAGDSAYSVSGATLSPDGGTFVFTRDVRRPRPPFVRSELWLLDVTTLATRKLIDLENQAFDGPADFAWAPDGHAVAFCGSSKLGFNGDPQTFSAFNNDLYVVPLDRPVLVEISGDFDPDVRCAPIRWTADGRIHAEANMGGRTLPVRTRQPVRAASGAVAIDTIPLPGAVATAVDVAAGRLVAATATPVSPGALYTLPLEGATPVRLRDFGTGALAQLELPDWERWDFTDSLGYDIEGWFLKPPHFDPSRKYPVIVWYYGGTAPTEMNFDARLVWFAGQGYVVYVLNPVGAPGFGQAFANLHINDWGYPAGTDIIQGVRAFAAAHPFVDSARIGNFGHSYGGFMTMHLLTRTDLFAASVSIAGISNIADYWGAGWWGFSYTEGTCPGCYPWNRRDVYVDRSPLFQADRIHTPLLLIHGTADTNVVPTESEQMFTALRVLGREAELVRVAGENHGISSTPAVTHRRDAMVLEWFDRWLRDRPAAWRARWAGETKAGAARTTEVPR